MRPFYIESESEKNQNNHHAIDTKVEAVVE